MAVYVPPGWTSEVHPPGTADFETTAVAWLLDGACRLAEERLEGSVRHPGRELSGEPGREKSTTSSGPVGTAEPGSTLPQVSDGSLRYEARE